MLTVLIVDDEPKIAAIARDYLEHAGFAVLTATDGPTALATVRQRHPDLVVLDLGLPGIDGLDVTRRLRGDPSTATLPIVMLTARDEEIDTLIGLEVGADDYLTKPFSPRELVARVRAVLRRTERAATAPGDLLHAVAEHDVQRDQEPGRHHQRLHHGRGVAAPAAQNPCRQHPGLRDQPRDGGLLEQLQPVPATRPRPE